jgi:hypothetical protein
MLSFKISMCYIRNEEMVSRCTVGSGAWPRRAEDEPVSRRFTSGEGIYAANSTPSQLRPSKVLQNSMDV